MNGDKSETVEPHLVSDFLFGHFSDTFPGKETLPPPPIVHNDVYSPTNELVLSR